MPELIIAPLIVFMVIVVPLWLIFHYLTVWRRERLQMRTEVAGDRALTQRAQQLEERLEAIERILDADAPDWRSRT